MNGCGRPRVSEQGCSHLHRRPPRQDHAHDRYLATFHASKKRGPYGCTEVTQPKSEIYRLRLTLFLLLCFFCFSSSGLNMTQAKLTVTRRITAPRTITVSIAASSAVVFIAILFLLSSSDTPITRQSGSAESLEKEHQRSIAMLRQNDKRDLQKSFNPLKVLATPYRLELALWCRSCPNRAYTSRRRKF